MMTIGGVKAGDKVAVIGCGGLGQIGARVAVVTGAQVTVVEINEDVWPEAEKAGVDKIVKSVDDLEADTYDVVVDYAGFGETTAKSINAIRRDGTIVVVGMGKLEATINTRDVILKQDRKSTRLNSSHVAS